MARLFEANERWAELSGYSLDELAPVSIATWTERTHPDDLARFRSVAPPDDGGDGPWMVKVAGHPLSAFDGIRLTQGESWSIEPIDQSAGSFSPLAGGYGPASYGKTASFMHTLRRVVGPAGFDTAMRTYAERFRFRHPTSDDLRATFDEVLGPRVVLGHTEPPVRGVVLQAFGEGNAPSTQIGRAHV